MPNTNTKLVDSKTIAALFELTPRRIQPVSYTHLDVYKRQMTRSTSSTGILQVFSKEAPDERLQNHHPGEG